MVDLEQGNRKLHDADASDEASSAKLWSVYISEAEKYDRALVESWRSNMEGMLIFAGLFSAILTAFLIESYKTLTQDSGDTTVFLLAQISQQLAASANGTVSSITPPTPFAPAPASLICNALWFISLGLSLSCALIATLLEQWARGFLHRADMRSAPVIRARIFSFLYYGLKRFNMHAVVEVIPLLLHASLLLFFAGLVAFLIPVNTLIMGVSAALAVLVIVVYSGLTILPLFFLDCPYRTPLSGSLWRAKQQATNLFLLLGKFPPSSHLEAARPQSETIIEAISRTATEMSGSRNQRDCRALIWTVKSLSDDLELEPFIESIPDVLWGPKGRRYLYDDHVMALALKPNVRLVARMEGLLRSCDDGLLSTEAKTRRQIICLKAIWAIASLAEPTTASQQFQPTFDLSLTSEFYQNPTVAHYTVSAVALSAWCNHWAILRSLSRLQEMKANLEVGCVPDEAEFQLALRLESLGNLRFPPMPEVLSFADGATADDLSSFASWVHVVSNIVEQSFNRDVPWSIIFRYLENAAKLVAESDTMPYANRRTQEILERPTNAEPSLRSLNATFDNIVSGDLDKVRGDPEVHPFDEILGRIASFYRQSGPDLPRALISYLVGRNSRAAESWVVNQFDKGVLRGLWASFASALAGSTDNAPTPSVLEALWHFSAADSQLQPEELYEAALSAVLQMPVSSASVSAIAMLKTAIIRSIQFENISYKKVTAERLETMLRNHLIPADTAVNSPAQIRATSESGKLELHSVLDTRLEEARIQILAEFLEHCASRSFVPDNAGSRTFVPYHAGETIRHIVEGRVGYRIHATHQLRFAHSIRGVFDPEYDFQPEMLAAVVDNLTFGRRDAAVGTAWLSSPAARTLIRESLVGYADRLSHSDFASVIAVIQRIVNALEAGRE
ncbi:hypothetical protein FB451DRAFT_136526 [Mycena latifolia]|nr:hypothetical protein FB451DRAFT_136526 [Mycena latifolia]